MNWKLFGNSVILCVNKWIAYFYNGTISGEPQMPNNAKSPFDFGPVQPSTRPRPSNRSRSFIMACIVVVNIIWLASHIAIVALRTPPISIDSAAAETRRLRLKAEDSASFLMLAAVNAGLIYAYRKSS